MCRLLCIKSNSEFNPALYVKEFAQACKISKEFQGHGWGYSSFSKGRWNVYKNILPIWEDDLTNIPDSIVLLVHARSAFRDKGISIENNMPFYDDTYHFIFNGELHGVKLKEEGRIGAEKIFNFIKRFDDGGIEHAIGKSTGIIVKKSNYVRAMNFIIAREEKIFVHSFFNEEPEYFTLHYYADPNIKIICSEKLSMFDNWQNIPNNSIKVF